MAEPIHVIDSHTAGEPTRVVISGGPDLGTGSVKSRMERFNAEFDHYRRGIVTEPRGSDVLVGALLCEPSHGDCQAGVIFFNNVGCLGMCGHGMIGVVETLRHLGRISAGRQRIETPVGVVTTTLHDDRRVSVTNVTSYRAETNVEVDVESIGKVIGDVAWGGNWFYLVNQPRPAIRLDRSGELQAMATAIRMAVHRAGFSQVDHVELYSDSVDADADSRNFVLCPGLEYDRSPCGTGTSAKLACLAADGKLAPGEFWVQEGILGTKFKGCYQWSDQATGRIDPTITGQAFVTAEAKLVIDSDDPFGWGFPG